MSARKRLGIALVATALTALAATPLQAQAQTPPTATKPKLTRPPKLVTFVEAPYPASERALGRAAAVVLQVAIGADGKVVDAVVSESAGAAFDAAAIAAVRGFVFEPAEIDGKPAPIRILYRYEFVLKALTKETAELAGTLKRRVGGVPIAGATVTLETGQQTTTDAKGAFLFSDVVPGKHTVTLSGSGLTTVGTEEILEAGKRVTATYELDVKEAPAPGASSEDEYEMVVVAPPLKKEVVSTEVSADLGRRVPGTQGDVLKVVESMPGVARSAVGSGALVVWGAAPQDTRVYVDGVRIPTLYHNGGARSVIHSDMVKAVELSPGGYGAAYGRGIGGLVAVSLRPLEDDGFHGSVAVDLLDAAVMMRAPITDRLRIAVAARRSHLDAVLAKVTSRDIGDVVPIPRYRDAQARLVYAIAPHETIELGGLYSSDAIDRTLLDADPAQIKRETRDLGFTRAYLRWERQTEDGSTVAIVPSIGTESSRLRSAFGATPTELDVDATSYALRASYRGQIAPAVRMTVGLDTELVTSTLRRVGSVTSPPREGDVRVFGQAPSDQVARDEWTTAIGSLAPYAEADVALLDDTLHVVPGVRFEPYLITGSRRTPAQGDTPAIGFTSEDTEIEPRVAVRYTPVPRVTAKAAFGVYHQAPLPDDLSAVFGKPLLDVSHATHWLIGAQVKLTDEITAEATGFRSSSRDLAIRSPSLSPLLAQALEGTGLGRSFGAQLLVRQSLSKGLFGWLSYSVIRSERTDRPDGPWRPFDYDQTHVLTALASYDLGRGFELGARARYATGFPRTPVVRAFYDARRDGYDPVFGAHNSIRIPAFYQFDLRFSKRFKLPPSETSEGEIYLDVQNVTNHGNPEEIVYTFDYAQKKYITGLPILPVVGAKWSW